MIYELVYKHCSIYNADWHELFVRSGNKEDCLKAVTKYGITLCGDYDTGVEDGFYIRELKPLDMSDHEEENIKILVNNFNQKQQELEEAKKLKIFGFNQWL